MTDIDTDAAATPDRPEFPELGFYGLAGHAADPRALVDEIAGRAAGSRLGVPVRTVQLQGRHGAGRRGGRHELSPRHRHGGDQPQHAPPAGDGDGGNDTAPDVGWAVLHSASGEASTRCST